MPRSIWRGAISFGLVNVPVKLYSAVSKKTVRFNQLHDDGHARIQHEAVSARRTAGGPLRGDRQGLRDQPGPLRRDHPEELEALDPKKTRTIDIEDFVDLDEIDPLFYEHPYYLVPDTGAAKAYKLLLEALEETNKVAIARVVIRSKEYLTAIRPGRRRADDGDDAVRRRADRSRADSTSCPDDDVKATEREVDMARQLIESLATDFDPTKYRDEYRERVLELIERKAEGEEIAVAAGARGAGRGAGPDGGARGEPRGRQAGAQAADRSDGAAKAATAREADAQPRPRRPRPSKARLGARRAAPAQEAQRPSRPRAGRQGVSAAPSRSRSRAAACKLSNLDKVLYPAVGFTKGQVIDYYTRDRAGAAAAPARPAADAQALSGRRRGQVLLREAVPVAPARLGADGAGPAPNEQDDRLLPRQRPADAGVGWRTWPTSSCTPRCRWPRTSSGPTMMVFDLDPGAPAGDPRVRARSGCGCATLLERARARELPEDLGLEGPAGLRAAQQRRSPTTRPSRSRTRSPSCSRSSIPKLVVSKHEEGAARGQGARRLEPERRLQDDGLRLLAARAGAADGVDAGRAGTRSRTRSRRGSAERLVFEAEEVLERVERARRPVRAGARS